MVARAKLIAKRRAEKLNNSRLKIYLRSTLNCDNCCVKALMIHLNNKPKQAQSKMIVLELVQHSTDYGYEDKLTILSSPIHKVGIR